MDISTDQKELAEKLTGLAKCAQFLLWCVPKAIQEGEDFKLHQRNMSDFYDYAQTLRPQAIEGGKIES